MWHGWHASAWSRLWRFKPSRLTEIRGELAGFECQRYEKQDHLWAGKPPSLASLDWNMRP